MEPSEFILSAWEQVKSQIARSENRKDALPACIVTWPFHQWQTGWYDIVNYQNAD
jgi:hypothetical protein